MAEGRTRRGGRGRSARSEAMCARVCLNINGQQEPCFVDVGVGERQWVHQRQRWRRWAPCRAHPKRKLGERVGRIKLKLKQELTSDQ